MGGLAAGYAIGIVGDYVSLHLNAYAREICTKKSFQLNNSVFVGMSEKVVYLLLWF